MTVSQDAESLRLKRIIDNKHPDYVKHIDEWRFLRQAVDGGASYLEGNLFKHPQEDPTVYAERSKRAADNHYNLCQLVNDTYEGYIFQNYPQLEDGVDKLFQQFVDTADMDGKPLISLAKAIMHWMDTYGVIYVCIDKPAAAALAANAAQEMDLGLIPYGYVVHPTHVLNGKYRRGKFQWLLVQEDILDNDNPWVSSNKVVTQWRLWEPDRWTLIQMHTGPNGEEIYTATEGVNELGEVPFVRFTFMETDGFACKSLLSDIARMDRAIFNKCSLLDEIHYAATFPQLAVPFSGDLYDGDGLTGEGKNILQMGLNSVLPYHSESGAPTYVCPDSGPSDSLEKNIENMARMALSLALLDGEVARDGQVKSASSGVSKAYVFEKLNRRLANIADTLQEGFWAVFRMVALWMDKPVDELPAIIWAFPDTFEVRSLAQEIDDVINLLKAGIPSETAKQIMFKDLVKKAFGDLTQEEYDKIFSEIESFDYESMDVYWKQVLPDPAEVGPGANKPTGITSKGQNPNHDGIAKNAAGNAANKISQSHGGGKDARK